MTYVTTMDIIAWGRKILMEGDLMQGEPLV